MVKRCCYVKAWRRRWLYFISEFSYCKSVRLSWAIFTKGESRGEHVNMKNFDQDVFGTSLLYGIVATLSVTLAKETSFVRVVHHTIHWTQIFHPCLTWKLCLKFSLFPSDIGFLNGKKKFSRSSTTRKKIMLSRLFIDVKFLKLLKTLPCLEHHYPGWNDV